MINKNEKGQAALVFIFGMVAFIGFAGLAIDGGRLYSEHRKVQSVADTSALSAAMVISQHDETITQAIKDKAIFAAKSRSKQNGYGEGNSNVSTYLAEVSTESNLADGTAQFGYYYIVTVKIESVIPPTLIQMLWDGEMVNTAEAQVRVTARSNAGFGQAMVSLKKGNSDCQDNSMKFSGSGTTTINGSIYNMTNCPDGTLVNNVAAQGIINGTTTMVGGYEAPGGSLFNPGTLVPGANESVLPNIPTPDCSALPIDPPITKESDAKGVYNVFWPGVYPKGIHISWGGGRQKFKSGLYCLGADFKVTNGQVTNYTATEGATFYLYNGSVSLSSSNFINLHAPQHGEVVDPSGNNWDGMLFYIDEDNNGVFDVTGNADTTLEGTVYAPGLPPGNTAKCKITGSGSLKNPDDTTSGNYDLQLLCYTIEITGSADVTITYDGDKAYKPPTTLDLYK